MFTGAHHNTFNNPQFQFISGDKPVNNYDGGESISSEQREKQLQEIIKWLKPSSPSQNYNEYKEKKTLAKTGEWFISGKKYKEWKETANSMIWIQGEMGCGKSVLVSTIIQNLEESYLANSDANVAYYFFDFRDSSKQTVKNLIVSLLIQLSHNAVITPAAYGILKQFYDKNRSGMDEPGLLELENALLEVISLSLWKSTTIIIDALDEMEGKMFQSFLGFIKHLHAKNLQHLHVIVTSRPQIPIAIQLKELCSRSLGVIPFDKRDVHADVEILLEYTLNEHHSFERLNLALKTEIKRTLLENVNGM
ncbi:hypothetical protein K435DRAFT_861403 [Dendrothele bispora CBS 962.96]|uniref:NACHT domain-containing protein n=1 Tax=Dendrothele bispora (strain CBS 962.96) TaxID=1314807 RepID=A0A4S8LW10_DENBC|nr:hypothetical protein K435DRAFT_861403 [Dendrothele bispora CBS 962.96]